MKNIFRFIPPKAGFLFVAFCIFTSTNPLLAQWIQTNGPYGGQVLSFAGSGTNLFAGTYGGGVFLSTNNGTSWTEVNTGLTNTYVFALAVSGTNLFAGTFGGVFLSTNNGTDWTEVNSGLTNTTVYSLAVSNINLFAGTSGGGVFLSTNNGTSWTEVNTGLTSTTVYTLAPSGTNLFAGTSGGGVFLSTNNGTNWTEVNTGLTDLTIRAFAISSPNLFAGTGGGVWRRPLSEIITSVEALSTDLPTHFSLDQNYPNPFNPATTISFSLPSRSFVLLKVFDALGREVDVLLSEELSAGTYSQQWTPKGLSTGVYLYRLQAGNFVKTNKLILLR